MVNKVLLHLEANEIRNDKFTSFETKEILIDTLKKESGYKKDLELSDEKRSQHREKQAILTKLKTEGQSPEFVDRVRKSFYPWYDSSHKKYDESLEQVSDHIDAAYIDELLQTEGFKDQSKTQLTKIKDLMSKNPVSKLDKSRLTVKNGLVVIDGFVLPEETQRQTYAEMSEENSKHLYPDFAIALLNFTADAKGKQFDRKGLNKNNLIDRSLDGKEVCKQLNTENNFDILRSLSAIIDIDPSYIPMGIDKNGCVIYAWLRSDSIRFNCVSTHRDFDFCLVLS